ncbi:ABC transporter ATP-binding protein/permease [Paenibacillus alginolyticus]|uniref:ABC transporter ATP-binding protein/permease n=1 Tax=Paenibacillus alginolyticus TaxID=59839 RepID=A0ABT4GC69_9BACL|nr:ABC transporter ATP-binding protein [Paenibacillus alginolyticus]MCY9669453.1 ABC transporter ATP-binding protein/permease [Paenibacillus alginolyticus]MCY9693754.1 ABC transporter ATP-binding protein/permease [Paenibacillus alginolyticus]MEC0142445.1 ABC transporter ATP-binding protein [Paenibacillus alginolyticus]
MFKLFRLLKPYKASVVAIITLMLLQSLAQLYLPTLLADIVDVGVVKGDIAYILRFGAYMLLVAMGAMVCVIIASYLLARTATGFGRDLRRTLFTHVESFSLHEFDKLGTSSLITRTTNDIAQVQQVIVMMRMFIGAPTMLVGGVIMATYKDAHLAIVLISIIPILALAIVGIMRKGLPLFKTLQVKIDGINLVLRENLTGIRVIRAFNRSEHEKRKFEKANQDYTQTAIKVNVIMSTMMPIMMLVFNLGVVVILWYGGVRIDANQMQIGDLMAFIQYAMQIMFSMFMMTMIFMMIPRASASSVRINEVLAHQSNIHSAEMAKSLDSKQAAVEFKHVSFSYPGAEQPAIRDLSFRAEPGEVTAIIGGTGSGKTTLIHLLLRFYDVESGTITLDGHPLSTLKLESLRQQIGYVPQKAALFSGTVADNIRFGREMATEEEIQHAATTAQAADFITEMKDGYLAVLAQGGTNLSGGQKQRLAIARALVRKPNIYVFDDSFSALDFKTDAKLRAALKAETEHATMIIVAQRVSTIMDANRIIVLEEGQIAGIGTHSELMKTCAVYQEIVASQLSEEEIA